MPSRTKPPYIVDLPFEIWQHVSSFLSVDEVRELHGLSRMLRNIALDKRYRCVKVNFAPRNHGTYANRFRHLGEDHIAGRVREIHFLPYISPDPFDLTGISGKENLRARSPLRGLFEETSVPDANTVVNTIARFKKVSNLRIDSTYDTRMRPPGLQLIHGGLRIFANTLRSLVLSLPLEMMSTIILPDLVLTRLETLEILPSPLERPTFQTDILQVFSNTLKATILPFVNRHRLSLRSFNFNPPKFHVSLTPFSAKVVTYFNLNLFFEGLNYISHLESASFSVPIDSARNDATHRFFAQHSKTLRRLNISMAHMTVLDYHSFLEQLEVPLPHIEALTLDFGFRSRQPISDPSLSKFLQQYSPSLKSLKLLRKQHGKREIFSLFEIPHGSPIIYSKLRYLEIWLYCLTPEIMDLIAFSLPDLEDLELAVRIFRGEMASIETERDQFCVEMSLRNYYEWRLQRLVLKNISSQTMLRSNVNCINAVVEALPRLLTINQVHRVDYLADYWRV